MADIADILSDSDSDDSDDSGLPFDVEIEKCEKRLQLARYKKKYRNVWNYVTDRWQNDHVHIVLKDLEQKWRVYSAGSHEQIHFQNISEAFRYLEDVFEDRLKHPTPVCGEEEIKCDYEELQKMKFNLCHYIHVYSEYIEFFEGVAEINYGREARAIYDGGMHDSTMRNARTRYGRKPELNMQFIFNNFSSSRSVRQLKLKFMSNVFSKLVPGEPASRKIEAPDIYTLKCIASIISIPFNFSFLSLIASV